MYRGTIWEASSRLATYAFSHLLWNLKVHCHVYNSIPLANVVSHDESITHPLFLLI
jgi:hypothetical protein